MTQILVSLAILTLWALTSLLSREAQPLPPRTTRGLAPGGPRPAAAFAGNDQLGANAGRATSDRLSGGMTDSRFSSRTPESSPLARSAPARTGPSSDDIRILESNPSASRPTSGASSLSSSASARAARSQTRRGSRGRPTSPSPAKPLEPRRQRALTSQVNQSMAQAMGRPYEGLQLEAPLASLSSSLTSLTTKVSSEHDKRALPLGPGVDVDAIRAMLASPARLREIAFLSELLQPPLALRRRSRLR